MTYRPYLVRVAERAELSPHFVRVTFAADELAALGWDGPDQRIKLVFPTEGAEFPDMHGDDWYDRWRSMPVRPPMRTYTTRYADPGNGRLVVDFVSHGDTGPATRWVNRAGIGDELVVVAPDATSGIDAGGYEWRPGDAGTLLIVADESAVPAALAIVENLPADAVGAVFLEVPSSADRLAITPPARIELTWLARDANAHGALLGAAARAWAANLPEDLYAWLAGEAGVITGLRRHLVRDLGVDRRRVEFMGYWKTGRAESD